MTLAVVAILGHFSKTLLLFFIPQILNFLYSLPQLFHFIPCPRHRLPKFDPDTDTVGNSYALFKETEMKPLGRLALKILTGLWLVKARSFDKDGERYVEINNLTLINFALNVFGPMHERSLTLVLLAFQVLCSGLAFGIRYPLAKLFYGEIIA